MCFSSKVKTAKTDPNSLKAPEPVLIEEPKGVDFGASTDNQSTDTGVSATTVAKDTPSDKGDGSSSAVATDTGTTTKKPKSASIKRALTKVTA